MELIEDLKAIHGHLEPKWARFSSQISDGFGNEKSFSDLETFAEFRFNIFDQWFGEPEKESKLNQEFMGFGQMGEGSVAAIWLLEGSDLETSPVVLIGSEGEVGVIAPDYLTFMLLIGQGFGMYEMLEGKHNAGCDACIPFLEFIKKEFKMNSLENVSEVLQQAKKDNPNLEEYLF